MADAVKSRAVVLVVEDDTLIRLNAMSLVEAAGYDVLEAADADAAIALLENRTDIVLVFTDIQMPGSMDGIKLAAAVRDRWPPIKIVATSGHFKSLEGLLPKGGRFLAKPYSGAEVTEVIRELVSEA